jgi:hypothetical protein
MLNLGKTTMSMLGKAISSNRPNSGPNGAGGGAPWPTTNQPIFVGLPLIIFWTWPMVVLR